MEVDESPQRYGSSLMTSIHNLFTSTSASTKKLLGLAQYAEDEKYVMKAVEYLVKRLKKKPGSVDNLLYALQNPQLPSKCVTIPRSMDGRLQVFHRKGHPHVIYCRLWRWPELTSHHQLCELDYCKFPFSNKQNEEVCINPYHYNMRVSSPPPAVMVPKACILDDDTADALLNALDSIPPPPPHLVPQNVSLQHINPGGASRGNPDSGYQMPLSPTYTNSSCEASPFGQSSTSPETAANLACANKENVPVLNQQPDYNQFSQYRDQQQQQQQQHVYHQQIQQQQQYQQQYQPQQQQYCNFQPQPERQITPVPYQEPISWGSIAYYELTTRVGEIFQCGQPIITVDGYTDPTTKDRFSIGRLTTSQRTDSIRKTRQAIGHGLQLHYVNDEVHVECISDQAIFVQSRNCNYELGYQPITVFKVPPKYSLKIFDNHVFCELLSKTVQHGFEAVYELTKMCTVRMSFVKGWGTDYQRRDVTETPCWIEIHLNGPLKWLDNVLSNMGSPSSYISSVS